MNNLDLWCICWIKYSTSSNPGIVIGGNGGEYNSGMPPDQRSSSGSSVSFFWSDEMDLRQFGQKFHSRYMEKSKNKMDLLKSQAWSWDEFLRTPDPLNWRLACQVHLAYLEAFALLTFLD